MIKNKNLYEILNTDPEATIEEIKKAFRKLALIYHPDKNSNSPESRVNFQIINNAYTTLISSEKRNEYDTYLKTSSVAQNRPEGNFKGSSFSPGQDDPGLSLENLCNQFNFILWEIEDILNPSKHLNNDTRYSGFTIQQWILKVLVFIDQWVLGPAGFIDYFYEARNIDSKKAADLLKDGFSNYTHQPYRNLTDYFYEIRKRMDKFIKSIKIDDVLKDVAGYEIKLIDSMFEAQKLAYHYLGTINLINNDLSSSVCKFNHSNSCYDEGYRNLIDFHKQ